MKKFFINLLCGLIPSRRLRHKLRHKLYGKKQQKSISDYGTNNIVQIIAPDGTVRNVTHIPNTEIVFSGDNNTIKIYEPLGALKLRVHVCGNVTITLRPSNAERTIQIIKNPRGAAIKNHIYIGDNFCDTGNLVIDLCLGGGNVTIGNDCLFSWNVTIRTGDHHSITDMSGNLLNPNSDVTIGNHVWCGSDVMFMKGAQIPDNCVIGTHTFVNKKFTNENCVIAGTPARIIRKNIKWNGYAPDEYNAMHTVQ